MFTRLYYSLVNLSKFFFKMFIRPCELFIFIQKMFTRQTYLFLSWKCSRKALWTYQHFSWKCCELINFFLENVHKELINQINSLNIDYFDDISLVSFDFESLYIFSWNILNPEVTDPTRLSAWRPPHAVSGTSADGLCAQ